MNQQKESREWEEGAWAGVGKGEVAEELREEEVLLG